MEQIYQGLIQNLDVGKYAIIGEGSKPIYDWHQMEQIRQDLEKAKQ